MSFRKGSKVWVEDKDLSWTEAEVVEVKDKLVSLITAQRKKINVPPDKLLPRDADADLGGVDDMTKLTYLSEPGVLYNLARRYALNEIYTYTGSILIAVNPFTKLPHLYNAHMMEQYKGVRFGDLSPHVFAIADASYRNFELHDSSPYISHKVLMKISSQEMGKEIPSFTSLPTSMSCCREDHQQPRVVDAEKYKLGHPSEFHYLNQSKTYELDGVSNAEEYWKTRRSMDIVGINYSDQEAIFRTLAAILHLGNIEFSPGKEHDSSIVKDTQSTFHLEMASELFMCDAGLLLATLCSRSIKTREGTIIKALDCASATANRDVLAKTVYARLFDWLVENINKSVGQDPDSRIQIGVLDIYGFECFKNNSFEQFCINFANEKLQQHFNEHVFKMEQEEYRNEEINWSYIEFIDNQDILDLIEKKPIGIISLLDEACMFPKSTHETFSTKLFQSFKTHPRLEKAKFSETDFTMSHYAGKVTYQSDSFLDKNRDYVIIEHCNLLSSSKCCFISGLFALLPEESSRSSYKFSSVASRFKQQLQALMETLNATEPHYVRCIKPNSSNRPQKFENQSVLHQLRCGGVLEAVRISLAGYPTRRTYSEFIDRFGLLAPELMDGSYDEMTVTEKILQKLKLENFQLGRAKVFLRAGQIAILDSRRIEVLESAARLVQNRFRTYVTHKEFVLIKGAAISLQAYCRGCLARLLYEKRRQETATVVIQKHVRKWLLRRAFLHVHSAVLIIQSSIRSFSVRHKFTHLKEHRAATLIQAWWRMRMAYVAFCQHRRAAVSIQCAWRQKLAKRELRRLRLAANETGALRDAKNKLEKKLEDLAWRVALEKRLRVTSEETKAMEVSKLQKAMDLLNSELSAAKLATISEQKKNSVLLSQVDALAKDKAMLESSLEEMAEVRKENFNLKNSVESLAKKNSDLESDLQKVRNHSNETLKKLQDMETKYVQLQQNLQSMEDKLSTLQDENHILRQNAISTSPPANNLSVVPKFFSEKHSGEYTLPNINQSPTFESPTPTKYVAAVPRTLSESRRSRMTMEKHEEKHELLFRCIKEDLGFKDGKPVAACTIYRCLLQWRAFEAERTIIFDFIVESINDVLKVDAEHDILPYWLSNTSALLCLLQRNLRSNGLLTTPARRSAALGLSGKATPAQKTPLRLMGREDSVSHVDARYPAILFKQQLTACLEKIFGLIRDNLKKELSPLLSLCIQAPKTTRAHAGRASKSQCGGVQQPLSIHWDGIVKFLDSLLARLRNNYVPSFFIRKLITQVFSFMNIQLFNSLLLRRECCTFSNGEYVKSGLAVLEKWIADVTEEFAGTSWHELNYIRQAVGFLVIHQKRRKSLDEIQQDLCPALSVRQIYRICTMYWDDKYSTQSVSNEVVATMRDLVNKDSQSLMSNSFLLDDDMSIPFSTEDISKAIPAIDPMDVDIPPQLRQIPSAHLPVRRLEIPPT
ncbi:uncharacterized protein A4U43_C06F4260 [Asparagus officinalis]|uniref:Myosin motor domain-containing protein n=1 Tax=Asparagus officinalis TaxID=4686 RepID=A0A5P1ENH0_ASPOF|nr:uncharacterized protein A4U43_C06F4260 [Asparagus officinalis]